MLCNTERAYYMHIICICNMRAYYMPHSCILTNSNCTFIYDAVATCPVSRYNTF